MSEPRKPEPDEDLLEFLGGIDELNGDSQDEDFPGFLAKGGLKKPDGRKGVGTGDPAQDRAPAKGGQRE